MLPNPRALTFAELSQITTPTNVEGGNMEIIQLDLYDTAPVLAAGSRQLVYFTQSRANDGDTNLESPGSISAPKYFNIFSVHADLLRAPDSVATPAAWAEAHSVLIAGGARVRIQIQNKDYGPWPLSHAGSLGGITGFGFSMASATAAAQEFVNNGVPGAHGGVPVNGTLWLKPRAGFRVIVDWDTAPTVAADIPLRITLRGYEYRAIV